MKKILLGIVIGAFALQAWHRGHDPEPPPPHVQAIDNLEVERSTATPRFKCDGRTHCSHMTSCEEATFFLRNCPDVKMDGNRDGIPCEKQWCGG